MNLWKRIKNVFTDELVDKKELIDKANELLDAVEPVKEKEHGWSVDWDRLGTPFSVEWQKETKELKRGTLIGYWPPKCNDYTPGCVEPLEWHLPTTEEQHEEVVKDFEAWLDLKDQENKTND